MIFNNTGDFAKNFYMLGHPCAPVYLLDNETTPALFDSGFSIMGNRYIEETKKILKNRQPAFLFLTHAHFDHCGAAGLLQQAFPGMKIVASPLAKSILDKPKALDLIRKLSAEALPLANGLGLSGNKLPDFCPFSVDITVSEGDTVSLGPDLSVRILETPGHTRDSLSFFIPEHGVLLSGEALGIPDATGYIISECPSNYDQYAGSLQKLKALNPEVVCLGHYKVFTGPDAGDYISESLAHCIQFKELVKTFLQEEKGDTGRVMQRFKKLEYEGKREDAHPEAAYFINLTARIKTVLDSYKKGGDPFGDTALNL
jgi:glyoxylase-like metal-dependent hydrolase (beta-lactamase superfamily II)